MVGVVVEVVVVVVVGVGVAARSGCFQFAVVGVLLVWVLAALALPLAVLVAWRCWRDLPSVAVRVCRGVTRCPLCRVRAGPRRTWRRCRAST